MAPSSVMSAVVVAAALLLAPFAARADCSPSDPFADADAAPRVAAVRAAPSNAEKPGHQFRAQLHVEHVLKGPATPTTITVSFNPLGGTSLKPGRRYLVFFTPDGAIQQGCASVDLGDARARGMADALREWLRAADDRARTALLVRLGTSPPFAAHAAVTAAKALASSGALAADPAAAEAGSSVTRRAGTDDAGAPARSGKRGPKRRALPPASLELEGQAGVATPVCLGCTHPFASGPTLAALALARWTPFSFGVGLEMTSLPWLTGHADRYSADTRVSTAQLTVPVRVHLLRRSRYDAFIQTGTGVTFLVGSLGSGVCDNSPGPAAHLGLGIGGRITPALRLSAVMTGTLTVLAGGCTLDLARPEVPAVTLANRLALTWAP